MTRGVLRGGRDARGAPLDAIALDVAHVQGGRLGGGRTHAEQVRLDDNAARAGLKRVNGCGARTLLYDAQGTVRARVVEEPRPGEKHQFRFVSR